MQPSVQNESRVTEALYSASIPSIHVRLIGSHSSARHVKNDESELPSARRHEISKARNVPTAASPLAGPRLELDFSEVVYSASFRFDSLRLYFAQSFQSGMLPRILI